MQLELKHKKGLLSYCTAPCETTLSDITQITHKPGLQVAVRHNGKGGENGTYPIGNRLIKKKKLFLLYQTCRLGDCFAWAFALIDIQFIARFPYTTSTGGACSGLDGPIQSTMVRPCGYMCTRDLETDVMVPKDCFKISSRIIVS